MPPGEFSATQRYDIRRAIDSAKTASGYDFSVLVGESGDDPRAFACERHAALADPDRSVLVMVDPNGRVLEIVTGQVAHRVLSDSDVALAALAMRTSFTAGDLAGGIVHGVQQLAEHARVPKSLHTGRGSAPGAYDR